MRVVLLVALSADGRIAESEDQRSIDWTSDADREFFASESRKLGVVIMGRRTFETIGRPLKDRLTVVMTRAPQRYENIAGLLEHTGLGPAEILSDLSRRGYPSATVAGGGSVYSQFLRAGLVDEICLTIEPVLFGKGLPFLEGGARMRLHLLEILRIGPDSVALRYRVENPSPAPDLKPPLPG